MKVTKRLFMARIAGLGAILLIAVTHSSHPADSWIAHALQLSGFALLTLGALGRVWCAGYVSGNKTHTIVSTGPYSISRNPLYFFSLLAFLGVGLTCGSLVLSGVFGLIFFGTHWPKILKEERKLKRLHGAEYERYLAKVPRFVPRILSYKAPRTLSTISPVAFDRALRDSLLILLIFAVTRLNALGHEGGLLPTFLRLP